MRHHFVLLTTSLAMAGSVFPDLAMCADISRNEPAEFVLIAQTSGDVIDCRSSPSRHCILELALAAAEETDEEPATYDALVAISEAQAKAGEFEAAAATMDRIGTVLSKPSPRVNLAQLMAEAGRYDAARAVAEKIAEADDRAQAFLMIGEAAAKAGKLDLAENAYQASLVIAASLPPGRRAYYSIVQLSESWTRVAAASAERQITPVVLRMISAANTEAGREESIAALAAVHASAGNIDAAFAALRSLHDPDVSAQAQISIAGARARSGDVVGARATFNAALAKINQVRSHNFRDSIRGRAAEFLAENGDVSAAVGVVSAIESGFFRAQWLMRMAQDISTMPNRRSAREEIAAVLREAERIDDAQMRARTLWSVASAQAKMGDLVSARANVAAALATVGRIEKVTLRAMVYGSFGAMLARAGYGDDSQAAFDDALMTVGQITDVRELGGRAMALMSIAKDQAEVGNIAAARSIIERDLKHTLWKFVLVSITEAEARAGNVSDALASADQIEDPRSRVDAFTGIANELSQ